VDGRSALVLEQHLLDSQGRPIISAVTSQHRQDSTTGAWLPTKIDLTSHVGGQRTALSVTLGNLEVNTIGPGDAVLWHKPNYHEQGAPDIDLGNPNLRFSQPMQFSPIANPQGPAPQRGQRLGRLRK
jgi:hypothetical protein